MLYRNGGTAISKTIEEVEDRDPSSIIKYDEDKHGETLRKSLQWEDCPTQLREPITKLIKEYWDVFAPEGLKQHIRGFVCHIDTGNATPVCCNIPRYGPHEARVITELTRGLEANGLIEEARSPWGAQVVLAAKPNQAHVHWSEYIWRLTVSYRQLNAITRPFIYPSRRCDDAARDIGRSRHFITMDFESGFWQVLLHEKSRDKTAFFVPGGQKRWTVMPMGCLNAHGMFCCLVDTLKRHWNRKATDTGIRDDIEVTLKGERPWTDAEVIVDDIMLHSENTTALIQYFEIVLQTLQKHQVTVKLKKCRFFPQSAEFVGMDVEADGNRPARSKMEALDELKTQPPRTLTDLRKVIGLIGFYQDWIPNYELRIGQWRQHIKKLKGTQTTENETELLDTWTPSDQTLLIELLDELITRPTLARPDYTRRFYLKTDWSRLGMAAVLLQADPGDAKAAEHEKKETNGEGICQFDKHMRQLRLRPIAFASRKCSDSEGNMHSFTGEAATGVWAIEKYKRHLFGKEFTWMTDCNGLRQFFDGEDVPTHMHQRMRQRLLRFAFTIVHRPARFMVECDALTRYNSATSKWRPQPQPTTCDTLQPPIATTNVPIQETTNGKGTRTLLATKSTNGRTIWAFNAGTTNIQTATDDAGIIANIRLIEERDEWRRHPFDKEREDQQLETITNMEHTLETTTATVDWIVAHEGADTDDTTEMQNQYERLTRLIQLGRRHGIKAIMIFTKPNMTTTGEPTIGKRVRELEADGWHTLQATLHSNRYGAAIATKFTLIAATRNIETMRTFHLQGKEATPLSEYIDDEAEPTNPQIKTSPEIQAMRRARSDEPNMNEPKIAALIQRRAQETHTSDWVTAWTPCYDKDHPGPDITDATNQWYESPFAVETTDKTDHTTTVRGIRWHEIVNIIGYDEHPKYRLLQQYPETINTQTKLTPPKQLITATLNGMHQAETTTQTNEVNETEGEAEIYDEDTQVDEELRQALSAMLAAEFQQTTALPLPTMAQWQDATIMDWDLNTIVQALKDNRHINRDEIQSATLYKLWNDKKLEQEDGILYHTGKGSQNNRRHLRTRIPPPRLRQAIFAALHASPMAGHTGYQKTFWKIAARYYWPNMTADIKQMTLGCGHCNAANITGHEAQQKLNTFEADEPFDVITMDIWHPGKAASTRKGQGSHVVTCLDAMTGFAAATFVESLDAETITRAAFTAFFITHGLPRLVIIDSGSEFAGALITLCQNIQLPHYTVSKGNHKAIICERFHRYLNKIQKIHAANCETFQDFMFGTIFAVYAWNSAPVDGTNIVRSYAAIGREFPFPIDFERDDIVPRDHEAQGQQTLEHVHSAFPLWKQQQEVLKTLIEDRREHHRELKNHGRNMKTFAPGDLVVIKKQVQTSIENGPAKARMQARGPYRILEELKPGTYRLQRLPGVQGAGRRGRVTKESAARLTKIPSTLVLHKPAEGIDTRLATYRHAIVDNPLESILGLHEPGRYKQAEAHRPFAYDKIEDLWQEDIDNNWPQLGQHQANANIEDNDDSSDSENDVSDDNSDDGDDDNHGDNLDNGGNNTNGGTLNNESDDINNNPRSDNNEGDKTSTDNIINPSTTTNTNTNRNRNTGTQQHNRQQGDPEHQALPQDTHPREQQNQTVSNKKRKRTQPETNETPKPTRTSTRKTKAPARYQQEMPPQITQANNINQRRAHELYKRTIRSRDKLFFIKYTADTTNTARWYAVQAKMQDDDTESTRNEGKYTVWFYIREQQNSKSRKVRNCRFWPEIHQLRPNGQLGPIVPVRPGRAEKTLLEQPHKYRVYEQTVNLCENALVGPFDFAVPQHYQNEAHRIAFEEWEELKAAAVQHNIDVSDIEEVVPLR